MSQATTLNPRPGPQTLRARSILLAIASAAAMLVLGAVWGARMSGDATQDAAAVPAALAPPAAASDTSVPPASRVFGNQEVPVEEQAPTF